MMVQDFDVHADDNNPADDDDANDDHCDDYNL